MRRHPKTEKGKGKIPTRPGKKVRSCSRSPLVIHPLKRPGYLENSEVGRGRDRRETRDRNDAAPPAANKNCHAGLDKSLSPLRSKISTLRSQKTTNPGDLRVSPMKKLKNIDIECAFLSFQSFLFSCSRVFCSLRFRFCVFFARARALVRIR